MKCPTCKKPVKRKGYCPKCKKSYNEIWYQEHKEEQKARARKNNEIFRKEICALLNKLKNVPCADCHKRYPYYVMDFDHTKGKKLFGIAQWRAHGWTKLRILQEVKKCDVVCANCHRERTHQRSRGPTEKAAVS